MQKLQYYFILMFFVFLACDNEPIGDGFVFGNDDVDDGPSLTPCELAVLNTQEALVQYHLSNADTYIELCNQYVQALEYQIEVCGDDGSIQSEINSLDCTSFPEASPDSHAIMTANINGEQFNELVPHNYYSTNQAVHLSTVTNSYLDAFRYLSIVGTSSPEGYDSTDFTKVIYLYIAQINWHVGTYPLYNEFFQDDFPVSTVHIIYRDGTGYWDTDDDGDSDILSIISDGTVTVSEFNLIDKAIKGTFEFNFSFENIYTGEITGPFECLNGTFDYSLDHPYFN